MSELEAHYKQGKPQVKLSLNVNQKLQLELSPNIMTKPILKEKIRFANNLHGSPNPR